jgi:ubiquinone/menaquinone biosynthesis C-methylase UbiE
MTLSIDQWHQRYLQQARWTRNIRMYLYQRSELRRANRILDIGCGTGVLENEFPHETTANIFGVDIDLKALQFAKNNSPASFYTNSDCLGLPFASASFDNTLCHFFLLWVESVPDALTEMKRVTRSGGHVLALAEPDYGGRIDFPEELVKMGTWQTQALEIQGAKPLIGRQLRALFSKAGLTDIEVGVLGGRWTTHDANDFELEWQVLTSDLSHNPDFQEQADQFKTIELDSRKFQRRILFVPVFYAIGAVPT